MARQSARPVDILVGTRIKQARHATKVSRTELCQALGVSFQQVQKYENGSNRVSAGALQIIAERLKVPVPWLLGLKANGRSIEEADSEIDRVMGTRDGYATSAGPDGQKDRCRRARDRRADRQTGLAAAPSTQGRGVSRIRKNMSS
jgi:transcriptional regulator with XRE-family HTH domain